jgi:hypothetical protein
MINLWRLKVHHELENHPMGIDVSPKQSAAQITIVADAV